MHVDVDDCFSIGVTTGCGLTFLILSEEGDCVFDLPLSSLLRFIVDIGRERRYF